MRIFICIKYITIYVEEAVVVRNRFTRVSMLKVKAPGLWWYVWMVEGSLQPCLLCACTMHSYLPTPALAFFITHTMFCKAM